MFGLSKKSKGDDRPLTERPLELVASDHEQRAARRGSLIVYFDKSKGWRWRLVAPNGKITADSGESYIRRYDAKVAALRLSEVADSAVLDVREK